MLVNQQGEHQARKEVVFFDLKKNLTFGPWELSKGPDFGVHNLILIMNNEACTSESSALHFDPALRTPLLDAGAMWLYPFRDERGSIVVRICSFAVFICCLARGAETQTVSTSQGHACAVLADGTVWCWGQNAYGQLGQDYEPHEWTHAPAQVPGIDTATSVGTGYDHTCAALADGTVWCWGRFDEGNLGTDYYEDYQVKHQPTQVPGIATATGVFAGEDHTCAVLVDKTIFCWGEKDDGQLGVNLPDYQSVDSTHMPMRVPGIDTATNICAS